MGSDTNVEIYVYCIHDKGVFCLIIKGIDLLEFYGFIGFYMGIIKENKIKHLEMVEEEIKWMANKSFLLKG